VHIKDASYPVCSSASQVNLSGVEVRRKGRVEPLLQAQPTLSSLAAHRSGIVLEDYAVPACVIRRHEHDGRRVEATALAPMPIHAEIETYH